MSEPRAAYDDTGRFRAIEGTLSRIETAQQDNAKRLTEIEKVLVKQEEHSRALERAFAEIEKIRESEEAARRERHEQILKLAVFESRVRQTWIVASVFWVMFGGAVAFFAERSYERVSAAVLLVDQHERVLNDFLGGRDD
jgi:hypothetical protein